MQVLGAPLAAALLLMEGAGGLHGWQWLFIIEGAATALWGYCACGQYLPL